MGRAHERLDRSRWNKLCVLIKERDGNQCQICGTETDTTVDHIVPLSSAGDDPILFEQLAYSDTNLRVLCRYHNGQKQNQIMMRETWLDSDWFGPGLF